MNLHQKHYVHLFREDDDDNDDYSMNAFCPKYGVKLSSYL